MSFILRRIATTKTGKQIVRDQALPGDTISLGRESGNIIHIADLAVNPHHATISRQTPPEILAQRKPA